MEFILNDKSNRDFNFKIKETNEALTYIKPIH